MEVVSFGVGYWDSAKQWRIYRVYAAWGGLKNWAQKLCSLKKVFNFKRAARGRPLS